MLIVDDDPTVRMLLEDTLELFGLPGKTAANGHEALRVIREELPAAIVLDLMMPHMNGFSTLATLQRDPVLRAIPVIVLSAIADIDRQMTAFPGVIGVLSKGRFDVDALQTLLRKAGAFEDGAAIEGPTPPDAPA